MRRATDGFHWTHLISGCVNRHSLIRARALSFPRSLFQEELQLSKDPEEDEVVSLHGFKSDGPLAKFNDSLAIVVAMTRCIFVYVLLTVFDAIM